ncbi:hypothetical protein JOC75_004030 [Metabacillus crassostreae]|uniref:hypothetical protein n=1 Tax=Metabacillus crassostreae TaxID=929098 RepID=UPI00195D85AB|nr:hypothetical protein [Metabacillus crassostreae]MBM7606002.1 hypothetical protein [Metabacillus crassostreae]
MMNLKTDELLVKLEEQHKVHQSTSEEIDDLVKKQNDYLDKLIIELQPVYEWYSKKEYMFTHPNLKLKSGSGPILGYDENENEVIVLNVEKKRIEKVYLHDNKERKPYSTYRLVKHGYFEDAVNGLMYLEIMLDNYISRNNDSLSDLKLELSRFE